MRANIACSTLAAGHKERVLWRLHVGAELTSQRIQTSRAFGHLDVCLVNRTFDLQLFSSSQVRCQQIELAVLRVPTSVSRALWLAAVYCSWPSGHA